MMNDFTTLTNKIIGELVTVQQTYDPLQVPKQTLDDITEWVGLIALAKTEQIKGLLNQ